MKNLINTEDLHNRLGEEDLRIVDTRFALSATEAGREAYEYAHIPGAVYFDLDKDLSSPPQKHGGRHPLPDMQAFADTLAATGISNSSKVVVYDESSGVVGGRLWWMLRYVGHRAVQVLDGGFTGWLAADYPTDAAVPSPDQGIFTLDLQADMLANMDHVRRKLEDPTTRLIDARGRDRFRGENETMDPKAGHIPGAINLPYTENLAEGHYKSVEDLSAQVADLELEGADEIIVYCGSGVSAAHNLIALEEIGIEGAKLYIGSWSDWSSYPHNPVATGEET